MAAYCLAKTRGLIYTEEIRRRERKVGSLIMVRGDGREEKGKREELARNSCVLNTCYICI